MAVDHNIDISDFNQPDILDNITIIEAYICNIKKRLYWIWFFEENIEKKKLLLEQYFYKN